MYVEYANDIESSHEYVYYEQAERTSDIQLPPAMNVLLLAIWAVISLVGFAVMFLAKQPVAGAVIIAVPTFIGMVIKPTFALCIMMLVLPTGAGVAYRQIFSLDRGVGIALAVSFLLNIMISRPRLRIGNKALWVAAVYTIWICLASLARPYLGLELRLAFTQLQILALVLIVYWILETNTHESLIWVLRSYVIGSMGANLLTILTGAAMRSMQEGAQGRYAATLGNTVEPNMLASLTALAFLAAIYLLARDKSLFWRIIYIVAILFLPLVLLRIGSRGAMVAMAFAVLSPLLFVRQVLRKPGLAVLLLAVVVLASLSAGLLVTSRGLEAGVVGRLTDVQYAKNALGYRVSLMKSAVASAVIRPFGTGYYAWFERTGLRHWPHSDFFIALGVYGLPGVALFVGLVVMLIRTVRRMPLGHEKLYVRAVLTFLLVAGLSMTQIFHKYVWVSFAIILAAERTSWYWAAAKQTYDAQYSQEADTTY